MTDDTRPGGLLARDPLPLEGRTVLVTGVSRRRGIGHAVACRAAAYGASVVAHHHAPHDAAQPWGADDVGAVMDSVRSHLRPGAVLVDVPGDLAVPGEPQRVLDVALQARGRVDALVCNQAMSGPDGALGALTEEVLDAHWAVDARASLLLAQAFATQPGLGAAPRARVQPGSGAGTACGPADPAGPGGALGGGGSETPAEGSSWRGGAIVFLTSGQGLGPMPGEVAYAAAKAALAGVTLTVADQLADQRIRVNTVNPGPVDTGYATREDMEQTAPMFPFGRWGEPDDAARLITWLLTDEAQWVTGQVISSEGGFARWRH
ncbi:SDR family oxidoreductase [Actinomyces wuliandei]|uniref:SDR family oxidoreductase n=1 Tax=Actinomyces wuliandei TaxID=2057743 RepID=UPI001FAB10A5|nr:SDR family oxidoreductase [Actinomyces wuliandei]